MPPRTAPTGAPHEADDPSDPLVWPVIPRHEQVDPLHPYKKKQGSKTKRKGTFPDEDLTRKLFEALLDTDARSVFSRIVNRMESTNESAWRYCEHWQKTGHIVLFKFDYGAVLPRLTKHGFAYLQALRAAKSLVGNANVQESLSPLLRSRLARARASESDSQADPHAQ